MRFSRRLSLVVLLGLGIVFLAPALARADATPVITIDKILQTGEPGYSEPGDPITFRYEVTGSDRFVDVSVTDDTCSSVTPVLATSGPNSGYNVGDTIEPYGALNGLAGETWIYTCSTTAPAWVDPAASSTNTGHVSASSAWPVWEPDNPFTDDDAFTLKAVALRKAVFVFWNYNVGIPDPGAASVAFAVDVKNDGTKVGQESVAVDDPLYLWLAPGSWTLEEQTPPAGYRVFDGRGTWNVDLSGSWRDNSFIDGSDFDLAVQKSGPAWAYGGAAVTYGYTVTNSGPAAVKPVVTDDTCSPVGYTGGDANADGKIQSTETWTFTCTTTPSWPGVFNAGSPWALTNTATVVADEADDLAPAYPGGPIFGGDTSSANDTDTYTLYAFVLRKDVGLYHDGERPDFGAFSDHKAFTVRMFAGASLKATFSISELAPKHLWLSEGTWKFTEVNLPKGYFAFYPDATITYATGSGYPDWTHLNVTWSGCSHGYWKNHLSAWPAGYEPTDHVGAFFAGSHYSGSTLAQALAFTGGSGVAGAERILLRQAVAALLNEAKYGTAFGPYTSVAALKAAVSHALWDDDRHAMLDLAETLDHWNNGVCRLH